MRHTLFIIFTAIIIASTANTIAAQSLNEYAKEAERKAKELKREESARYTAILDSKDLNKYNQFIADYPNGKMTGEIRNRAEEVKLWNKAKATNTLEGYENYLKHSKYHWYDKEARNAINSLKRKVEQKAWDKVAAANTIEAYEQYVRENPQSGYKEEAEKAINRLKASQAWKQIAGTNSIDELKSFISDYPYASESILTMAKRRLHELKGYEYYKAAQLDDAYSEFSNISINLITSAEIREAYNAVMEYHAYTMICKTPTIADMEKFLNEYPQSDFCTRVSNMLAIEKAKSLGEYANQAYYNQALSYAKDSRTKNIVKYYISENKKKQKERTSRIKAVKRYENGGSVNLGIDFCDWATNGGYNDCTLWHYNAGLMLRFGNYKDRLQFAVGIKPGAFGYTGTTTYKEDTNVEFHLPVMFQLKLNLFGLSQNSRFFVSGQYQYNIIMVNVESRMAWTIGCGVAWKHFDLSMYYKKDFGEINYYRQTNDNSNCYKNQRFFGTSMIYYFCI